MGKATQGLHSFREKALTSARTFFSAASVFFLATASAGCMAEGEDSLKNLEQGEAESTATPLLLTPPSTTLGCAPLCNGGSCTPALLADYWPTHHIALTDSEVFFSGSAYPYTDNGFVGRVPKEGGPASFVLRNLATSPTVRQAGGDIYIIGAASPLPSLLNRLNADGSFTGFPTATGWPNFFTGDSTHLYWVDRNDGNFYSVPRTGGSLTVVAQSGTPTKPLQALVDEDNLYWVNRPASGKGWNLWKAPKTGGAAPTLLLSVLAGKFHSFTADATDIYFIDYYTGVNKIPKSGGAVTNIAYADDPGEHLVVDDERIYWLKDEVLTATCKDGSSSQALTANTYLTEDLAVDDSGIYWTQFYQVWKIAK